MKRSLILAMSALVVAAVAVLSHPGNTSARTLSEQEMWLTFGGQFPNDKWCEVKVECFGTPENDCTHADDSFQAWCESEPVYGQPRFDKDVYIPQDNLYYCVGEAQGWDCEDTGDIVLCMEKYRCKWHPDTDTCEIKTQGEGGHIFGADVRVPWFCMDEFWGM